MGQAQEAGLRVKSVRILLNLSRSELQEKTGISAATIRLWEDPRPNSKGISKKGATRFVKALRQINVDCTYQWLLYGVGNGPRKYESEDDQANAHHRKLETSTVSTIIIQSSLESIKATLPKLVPKESYGLISAGTFGVIPGSFNLGKTRRDHKQHSNVITKTFAIVPATYCRQKTYTELDVLCQISEQIGTLFVRYNKRLTPSKLMQLSMKIYKNIRQTSELPEKQMGLIPMFLSTLENGITIDVDSDALSSY